MTSSVSPASSLIRRMELPPARGPITERLFETLSTEAFDTAPGDTELPSDPVGDDDFQLALYIANELHYAGLEGVDERWEWAPGLMRQRWILEATFLESLRGLAPDPGDDDPSDVGHMLRDLVLKDSSPSLARYLELDGTLEQMREQIVHRSAYQLKEADPHSFTIPRLTGAAKVAMLEIQYDEYGSGRLERMHAAMFAETMRALGLDARYGAYLERLPGITLGAVNLNTLFAMHRRWRGASVGHLAVFEMTSSVPNRRYGNALRRMGFDSTVTGFYDEHVEADSVHEEIAAWQLAGGLCAVEPELTRDVLFGARAVLALEGRWAGHLLDCWKSGHSSLLPAS